MIDPDKPNMSLEDQIAAYFRDASERLRKIILHPPGSTPGAVAFNQSRAAQLLAQTDRILNDLNHRAHAWTGPALTKAVNKGLSEAAAQISLIRKVSPGVQLEGSLIGGPIDRGAIEFLARDTVGDFSKAITSIRSNATTVLRQMSATGVTNAEVNSMLAGGIIEGDRGRAIKQLQTALEKVHGDKVTIMTKVGPRDFRTDDYARMVANSKAKEASMVARHERLSQAGMDLVRIQGTITKFPCTRLVGKVFSLSGHSDTYPPFSTVSDGQQPYRLFHPHCHKFTVPFIVDLATPAQLANAALTQSAAA